MKVYKVGGAVRDELLGLPVKDRDHVVVGATPEEMERLGYRPVGRDFPVFLHPRTQEEYALARTERKTGRGYKGFTVYTTPDVTLEDDLARRDLTINAIAKDESTGDLIDPFNGAADLKAGVLRHVSPAFAEDPVRILRVARFAARFGFRIAPETFELMRRMVADGEADALVPERVWQEFAKGLLEPAPRRMFDALAACGALERVLPEWRRLDGPRALGALDRAAGLGCSPARALRCALRRWTRRRGRRSVGALAGARGLPRPRGPRGALGGACAGRAPARRRRAGRAPGTRRRVPAAGAVRIARRRLRVRCERDRRRRSVAATVHRARARRGAGCRRGCDSRREPAGRGGRSARRARGRRARRVMGVGAATRTSYPARPTLG